MITFFKTEAKKTIKSGTLCARCYFKIFFRHIQDILSCLKNYTWHYTGKYLAFSRTTTKRNSIWRYTANYSAYSRTTTKRLAAGRPQISHEKDLLMMPCYIGSQETIRSIALQINLYIWIDIPFPQQKDVKCFPKILSSKICDLAKWCVDCKQWIWDKKKEKNFHGVIGAMTLHI